jgi:hypothetical protein
MRFDADALTGLVVPPKTDGHARVHTAPTAILVVPRTKTLGFTQLYRHFRLYLAMLELRAKTVNGTNSGERAKE